MYLPGLKVLKECIQKLGSKMPLTRVTVVLISCFPPMLLGAPDPHSEMGPVCTFPSIHTVKVSLSDPNQKDTALPISQQGRRLNEYISGLFYDSSNPTPREVSS